MNFISMERNSKMKSKIKIEKIITDNTEIQNIIGKIIIIIKVI